MKEISLMTMADAAARTSLSTRTLRRAAKRGALPVVRVGRAVRVSHTALSAFVAGHTETTADAEDGRG